MANQWFDSTVTPELDGFDSAQNPTFLTSTYGNGRTRNHRYMTDAPRELQQSFVLTGPQKMLLESWWDSTAGADNGAATFMMPCHINDGVSEWECISTGMYAESKFGTFLWRIVLTVRLIDKPSLPGEWWQYYPEAVTSAGIIDEAVNEVLP